MVLLAAIAALSFLSGGYLPQRTTPVVFVLAGFALWGIWRGRGFVRPSRPYLIALGAFAALVAWIGLSVLWSTGPDLSWVAFDVAALYLLVMAAVGSLPGGPRQIRLAVRGFALIVLVVSAYAFFGKVAPDVVTHAHLFARLRAPVGYWNVLAALIVMALPAYLVTASRGWRQPWVRGLAASAIVLLLLTYFFTFSRGGYVALGVALIVYFALATRRLSAFVSLAIPLVFTAAVLLQVRGLGTLFATTTDDRLRAVQGHQLAVWSVVALVLAGVAQVAVAYAERRWTLSARQTRVVGTVVIAVVVLAPLAFGTFSIVRHGGVGWVADQYHAALTETSYTNSVRRLTSLGTSGRMPWYREAIRGFSHHPLAGTGAGTFGITDELYRVTTFEAKHSHSQWLNVLTELGVVGFALFLVASLRPSGGGLRHAGRDRDDPCRSLLAACQAAIAAFVVHCRSTGAGTWPPSPLAFLLLAGVSASYVRDRTSRRPRRRRPGAVRAGPAWLRAGGPRLPHPSSPSLTVRRVATCAVLFVVASWALPYFSERATISAQDQLSRGQVAPAEAGRAPRRRARPALRRSPAHARRRAGPAGRSGRGGGDSAARRPSAASLLQALLPDGHAPPREFPRRGRGPGVVPRKRLS